MIATLTMRVNEINDQALVRFQSSEEFKPQQARDFLSAAYSEVLFPDSSLDGLGIFCKFCLAASLSREFLNSHVPASCPHRLVIKGGREFSKISEMLKDHCKTGWHIDATALFVQVNSRLSDQNLFSESAIEESQTRKFFIVLFNAVIFLMRQNLAFRSSNDPTHNDMRDVVKTQSFLAYNAGNFAELIVTIARLNKDAATFLTNSRKHLLSPLIQKRICHIIATVVREKIYALMHNKPFTLYVDESQDVSRASQLVVAVRFYDIISGHPKECFLTFLHLVSMTAVSIFDAVVGFLESPDNPLDTKYMVGACSDGCNTMFGCIGGFMTLLAEKYKGVFTIKCLLHGLNLAVVRACSFGPDGHAMIQNAVTATDHIVRWIAASGKRHHDYCEVMKEVVGLDFKKFKQLARVRWMQRIEGASALIGQMHGLVQFLQFIAFDSEKYSRDESKKDAQAFKAIVQTHSFLLSLTCVQKILSIVSDFTIYAQSERIDFACVIRKLQCAIQDTDHALSSVLEWSQANIFVPVDQLRLQALTDKEQQMFPVCADRQNVDIFIPIAYPRGAVTSSRHGTTTPLPGLAMPEQGVGESSDSYTKRKANRYFQTEIVQPMLETMSVMMKNMIGDDLMNELNATISSLLLIDVLPQLFPSIATLAAISNSDSEDSEESSDEQVMVEVEQQKKKKIRKDSKKEVQKKKRLEDAARFRANFILKYEGSWLAMKSTPPPKQIKDWQVRLVAAVNALKECLMRVGNDRVKDLLRAETSILSSVNQYIRSWTAMSLGDAFDICTLSRMMSIATADENPLFHLLLCICVTIGVANAKSERCFSALNLIKTTLRSRMGDVWLNDLATVSINRDVVVTYEEFIACLEKMFPLDKFWC